MEHPSTQATRAKFSPPSRPLEPRDIFPSVFPKSWDLPVQGRFCYRQSRASLRHSLTKRHWKSAHLACQSGRQSLSQSPVRRLFEQTGLLLTPPQQPVLPAGLVPWSGPILGPDHQPGRGRIPAPRPSTGLILGQAESAAIGATDRSHTDIKTDGDASACLGTGLHLMPEPGGENQQLACRWQAPHPAPHGFPCSRGSWPSRTRTWAPQAWQAWGSGC